MNNIKEIKYQKQNNFFYITLFITILISFVSCSKFDYINNKKYIKIEKIYLDSIQYAKKGNYEKSIKNLLLLDIIYPYNKFSKKSKLTIIFCYYKNLKYDLSLFHIKNYLLKYPYQKNDYIHYIKGLIYYDQYVIWYLKYLPINNLFKDIKYAKKSFVSFKYLIDNFPHSKYVLNSMQRIIFLKHKMIQYELSIVEFYLKKHAYLSAINRINFIIKNYHKNDNLNKSLKILDFLYKQSYFIDMSNEIKIILKINS